MTIFSWFGQKKQKKVPYIGLSENSEYRCFVWSQNTKIEYYFQPKTTDFSLPPQAGRSPQKITLIRPLPHRYIWRKVLFFPMNYDEQIIYRQIIHILQEELPLSLTEIYFDYKIEKQQDKQHQRLALFAVRKEYARKLLTHYRTILDSELHCYWRGFQYFTTETENKFYQVEAFAFKSTLTGIDIIKPQQDKNFIHIDQLNLPEEILDKNLYLAALGASLWNG